MSLANNYSAMPGYDMEGVEDVYTRIEEDGEAVISGISVLDAFDYAAEPLYEFIEAREERDPQPATLYGGAGLHSGSAPMEEPELNNEEETLLKEWVHNRDELDIVTEITMLDGNTEEFYWNMRQADPQSVNQPFSMVNLKSNSGENMGLRILRDYDPELLERGPLNKGSNVDPDHTSRLRYSDKNIQDDQWGWLQEPFLYAALDAEEGVHRQLEKDYGFLPELTPEYWLVDWNQSPEYDRSNEEIAMVYEWGEPLFTNGLSPKGAEKVGEHAATLHSLGLMTFLDRKPEEFVEDPHPEGYRAQQRDLEFVLHTTNQNRVNGRDMQDLVNQIEQGIYRYHRETGGSGSDTERIQVIERPKQVKGGKNDLMERIDEDLTHLIPDNVPMSIDPDVFPREVTKGLEWE